jgi:hypothetical protein
VLRDSIAQGYYSMQHELQAIEGKISAPQLERKSIRRQIVAENLFVE